MVDQDASESLSEGEFKYFMEKFFLRAEWKGVPENDKAAFLKPFLDEHTFEKINACSVLYQEDEFRGGPPDNEEKDEKKDEQKATEDSAEGAD